MDCHACGHGLVTFRVPAALRDHAPGKAAAIRTRCLALEPAPDAPADPDFSGLTEAIPQV
jgi:hypothetical protein